MTDLDDTDRARTSTAAPAGTSASRSYRTAMETLEPEDLIEQCIRLYTRVEQLEQALQTRIVIEQAKGVLAERMHVRPDDAFELLRFAARSERIKLNTLARQVVEESATPEAVVRAAAREQRWRSRALRERDEAIQERHELVRAAHEKQVQRRTRKAG